MNYHVSFSRRFISTFVFTISLAVFQSSVEAKAFVETAQPRIWPQGAPKASDTIVRSSIPRVPSEALPHCTFEAIKGFHATSLQWTYRMDKDFIDKVRSLGCTVQGTVAMAGHEYPFVDKPGHPTFEELSVVDLDLRPALRPGMSSPDYRELWGCINKPLSREIHLIMVKELVDQGVDSIQQDDPAMNHHARRWGACFCEHCTTKFRAFLKSEDLTAKQLKEFGIDDLDTFNYRDLLKQQNAPVYSCLDRWEAPSEELKQLFFTFQAEASAEFHRWWRNELNEYAGRYVPVSCNNYFGWDQPFYKVFDFGLRELNYKVFDIGVQEPIAKAANLYALSRHTAELGKLQCLTMPLNPELEYEGPEWISLTRKTLATTYAVGSWMQAPWDTYIAGKPRYFGEYSNYSDLLAFIRACPQYLDNYEDAAAFGTDIDDMRWPSSKPITIKDGSGKVYAFARAIRGEPNKPIVIHLIDWAEKPEPFTLSVDPEACFGDQKVTVRLSTPIPYDKQAHQTAWETKNYQPLVRWTQISKSLSAPLKIPALSPWGILVIELDKGDSAQAGTFAEVAQR